MPSSDTISFTEQPALPPATPGDGIIYSISHDLRAPLLNFQGFLRRLSAACQELRAQIETWPLSPEQRRACQHLLESKIDLSVDVMDRAARRMDALLNALLELSRAGREPLQPARVETAEIVSALVQEFRATAAEEGVEITIGPMPAVWADPGRLRQIFRYLLSNALKFLSADRLGQITVGGRAEASETICWVKDNGIGIRQDDHARLFLPFGKLQELDLPGHGIGLAAASKLVSQQAGRIWVESVHRQGSTFYIALPAAPGF